jgi:hypothetical protein
MITLPKLDALTRRRPSAVLGLTFDGGRLDGVALKRTNGSCQVRHAFSASMSLDLLTNDPELVGRELRNHLLAQGVHERECVVGLPLKWALVMHADVPDLPEGDIPGFLQIEAERGFPYDVQTLHVASSRCRTASGKQYAVLVGIPKNHLGLLEHALRAAKLKPVSFALGIAALQPAASEASNGVLALAIGESQVALQITCGDGVAALRALEGTLETAGGAQVLHADVVAREVRITLGQLPAEIRDAVRCIRVFGTRDLAQQLADELELRLDAAGLKIELMTRYGADELGLLSPPDATISPAFSLAGRFLADRPPQFEFLPPKVTAWQQVSERYASGKLRTVLTAAGSVAALAGLVFGVQQLQLLRYQSQWAKIEQRVTELKNVEGKIRLYRPWFDESVRCLTILRCLTEVFPLDGAVTAKTVEIRDLNTVVCTGTARNYQALLKTVEHLRAIPQAHDVNLGPARGQAPALQFSFSFHWTEGGTSAN